MNASRRILLLFESNVDTERLVLTVRGFAVADRDFLDIAVLAEEFLFTQGLEQLILANCRSQASYVNKILLHNAYSDQVFAIFFLSFAFLCLLLALLGSPFFLVLLDIGTKLGNPANNLSVLLRICHLIFF